MTENVAEKQGPEKVLTKEAFVKAPDQIDQPRQADWKDPRGTDSKDPSKNQSERRAVGVAAVDEYPTDTEAGSDTHPHAQKNTQ